MDDTTKNELLVKGDIVYLICHGKQDKWVVQSTITRFLELRKTIEEKGHTASAIVDLTDNDGYDAEARNVAIGAMKEDAIKTAIVGANLPMRTVVNFMTKVAGQSDKYQAFDTIQEAEKWLSEQ